MRAWHQSSQLIAFGHNVYTNHSLKTNSNFAFYCLHYVVSWCSEYSPMFGEEWPLSLEHQQKIAANTHSLLKCLDVEQDLIGRMATAECLTWEQLESITATTDQKERIRKLLSVMSRRSVRHFNQFIDCLRNTQKHLVALLVENTGNIWMFHIRPVLGILLVVGVKDAGLESTKCRRCYSISGKYCCSQWAWILSL